MWRCRLPPSPRPGSSWRTARTGGYRIRPSSGTRRRRRCAGSRTATGFSTGNACSGRSRGSASTSGCRGRRSEFDDADRFLRLLPERAFVVDLGCGDGRHAERIAAAGHRVLGVDYSFEALRVARQTQPENVDYRFLNLNDRHGLLGFALELIDQGCQPYFFARNLLHELPRLGRADLFVMLRGLLDGQTFLYATFDATPVERIPANPETWNLSVKSLRSRSLALAARHHRAD